MTARTLFSTLFASLVVFMALPGNGFAGGAKQPPMIFSTDMSGGDLQFLATAAEQGLLQATLGVLAADHAKSSEVKEYGQTLAKHHAVQNERIKLLAIKKGVTLPSGLNPHQNAIAEKLSKLDGLKFDKAYLEEVIQDQQAYAMVFQQATQSSDPEIKSFATASLVEIKQNLALLRKMTGIARPDPTPVRFRVIAPEPEKN